MATLTAPAVRFAADVTIDLSSIPAAKYATETFTVTGLTVDMVPIISPTNLEAGLIFGGGVITAANTLKLTVYNPTSAAINPASQTFQIICL